MQLPHPFRPPRLHRPHSTCDTTSVDSTLPPRLITDASAVANKARRLGRKKSREGRRLPYCPRSSTPAHSPRSRAHRPSTLRHHTYPDLPRGHPQNPSLSTANLQFKLLALKHTPSLPTTRFWQATQPNCTLTAQTLPPPAPCHLQSSDPSSPARFPSARAVARADSKQIEAAFTGQKARFFTFDSCDHLSLLSAAKFPPWPKHQ